MATPTAQYTTPPQYTPAPYLVESSTLTTDDFIRYFKDFYLSLEYISCAPALVFERLMANLVISKGSIFPKDPLKPDPGSDCQEHIVTIEEYRNENKALRLENDRLKAKLAEAHIELPSTKILATRSPHMGVFNSGEVEPGSRQNASKEISFDTPFTAPPKIIMGLRGIGMHSSYEPHIESYARDIQTNGFKVHIDTWHTWSTARICSTWLAVDPNDLEIQLGNFSTLEDHPLDEPQNMTTRAITFLRPYDAPPQVVVWLSAFSISENYNWSVKAYASDITTCGFTMHIDSLENTILYSATASWFACTANKPSVCTGTLEIPAKRSGSPKIYTTFENGGFTTPPRVLLAINSFTSLTGDRQIRVRGPEVDISGMTWGIDYGAWEDYNTPLPSASVSFIALG